MSNRLRSTYRSSRVARNLDARAAAGLQGREILVLSVNLLEVYCYDMSVREQTYKHDKLRTSTLGSLFASAFLPEGARRRQDCHLQLLLWHHQD